MKIYKLSIGIRYNQKIPINPSKTCGFVKRLAGKCHEYLRHIQLYSINFIFYSMNLKHFLEVGRGCRTINDKMCYTNHWIWKEEHVCTLTINKRTWLHGNISSLHDFRQNFHPAPPRIQVNPFPLILTSHTNHQHSKSIYTIMNFPICSPCGQLGSWCAGAPSRACCIHCQSSVTD